MALAAALWAAPATMAGPMASNYPSASGNNVIASSIASAKEMASGSGTRVNKDPESLLRYGLPINNKEVWTMFARGLVANIYCCVPNGSLRYDFVHFFQVRQLQKSIESIRINIQSKRKAAALDDLKKARGVINTKESQMTASCREATVCSDILASMKDKLEPLETTLRASADYLNGSDQERVALDKSYNTQDEIQKELTILEEQMIPAGETPRTWIFLHIG